MYKVRDRKHLTKSESQKVTSPLLYPPTGAVKAPSCQVKARPPACAIAASTEQRALETVVSDVV